MTIHINSMSFDVIDDGVVAAAAPGKYQRTGLNLKRVAPLSIGVWFIQADQDVTEDQWRDFAQWIGPLLDETDTVQAVQVDTDMVHMAKTVTIHPDSSVQIKPVIQISHYGML